MASAGSLTNGFQFGGSQGTITDTNGLLFMRARYYDPEAGRFISEDPLRLAAGLNLYAYAQGDPLGRTDPQGLDDNRVVLPNKVLAPALPGKLDPQFNYATVKSIQQQILKYESELKRNSQWGEYWLHEGNLEAASETAAKGQQYQQAIAKLEGDLYKQAPGLKNADWRANTPYKYASLYNTLPEIGEEAEGFSVQKFAGNFGRGMYRNASGMVNAIKDEVAYYLTVGSVPVGSYLSYLISQGAKVALVEGGTTVLILTAEGVVVYAFTEEAMKETGLDQHVVEFLQAGMPGADNTVNMELFFRQKYRNYYDTADRCDQKIKEIRETGLIYIP
jgi:RHS repeat-associated protein